MSEAQLLAESGAEVATDSKVGDKRRAAACETSSSAFSVTAQASKKRRKSRAVAKAPVRLLSAHDAAHFKTTVQHYTGLPTLHLPSPSPPAPPPLMAPIDIGPNASSSADCPLLASSAMADSLLSTLHMVSACLQLLHSSSARSNSGAWSEELSMCKRQTLAFLQGLSHTLSGSQLGREHPSAGSSASNSSIHDLAGLSNTLGSCDNVVRNSLLGDIDSNHSVDLNFSFDDGASDPKPFLAMQTHNIPIDTNENPSSPYSSSDCGISDLPPAFIGAKTRTEGPNSTNNCPSIFDYDDCEGRDPNPLIALETLEVVKLTKDHMSVSHGQVASVDYSLMSLHDSPPHDISHGNLDICQQSIVYEELPLVENHNMEAKQDSQFLDKVEVQAKELEKFLLEEHNNVDFFVSSFPKLLPII